MHQIYPDEGLVFLALRAVGSSADGLFWQLYENDVVPDLDSQLEDFTLIDWDEAIELAAASFGDTSVSNHVASIAAPPIAFENGSGVDKDVYGYVVLDPTQSFLVAVARFPDAPVTILDAGSQAIIPIIGDFSEWSTTP